MSSSDLIQSGDGFPGRTLLVVASPIEAAAVLRAVPGAPEIVDWRTQPLWSGCDLVRCGIGKTNAAAATALALSRTSYRTILSVGVAGALPGSDLAIGDAIAASASVYADEGLQTPQCFQDCAAMGFPLGPFAGSSIPADATLLNLLRPLADVAGPIATVSTCSGTNALAAMVRERTGAIAEAMEGAAVAHVAARFCQLHADRQIATGELRVISNTTGDRDCQAWDLKRALARLTEVLGRFRTVV